MQIGYGVDVGRQQDELDVDETARDAVERATRMLGARQPKSQRLTVVLDPRIAASFLSIIGGTLTGERVLKGRSPFADRMGDAIAAPVLTLIDDATNPDSLGADAHDGEGLATRPQPPDRRAGCCARSCTTATPRGARPRCPPAPPPAGTRRGRPSGASRSSPRPVTRRPRSCYAEVGDGLLVQDVTGLHSGVNAVSGDFSVGAEGVMIRGGTLAEPVREITLASTLQRMLLDIHAVGSDLEWLPGGDAGVSLVIGDVSLSGS